MQRPMWNQEAHKFNLNRKNLNELLAQRRRAQLPNRQILLEMAKHKCDLFTNSLCLESIDYPALVPIKCLTYLHIMIQLIFKHNLETDC